MSVILHLSDIHISDESTWQNLSMVRRTVLDDLSERPKLIVVSGDFTDHPESGVVARIGTAWKKSVLRKKTRGLQEIKETLEELRMACGQDCAMVVVPGNHDYREFGLVAWTNTSAAFDRIFVDWKKTAALRIDGRLVVVFTLDSNTNDARINAARGRVGKGELIRFRDEYERVRLEYAADFGPALKIAVLHHHPLPIADSEEAGYFGSDGFLGLDDSGIFLREMATRQIDIVLHGHKHHAFNTRIEINIDSVRRGLAVIAAGSASKEAEPEKSFNVIYVGRRSIAAEIWRRKSGVSFSRAERFQIVSYERYLARAFEDFIADKNVGCYSDLIYIVYSIKASGDCDILTQYRGLRATGNGDAVMSVSRNCPHGTFSGHSWEMTTPHPSQVIFEKSADIDPGKLLGTVRFQPELRPHLDAVNIEQRVRLYNAFAMDQEQRGRISDLGNTEHVSGGIGKPAAELSISVHFADGYVPAEIRAFAKDLATGNSDQEETERCRSNLRICPPSHTATLTLTKPLKGCNYFIEWELPPAPPRRYPLVDLGRCKLIRNSLLSLNVVDLSQNPLTSVFVTEVGTLAAEYNTPREEIEMGLMVFDPSIKRLRFVAGVLRPDSWKYRLFEGQGIAGRAHKIDRTLLYVPARANPESDFIAQPPAGGRLPDIIICIPIRFPVSTPSGVGETVAVVTLATYYAASSLLKLAEDDDSAKVITIESQILFCEQVMPKLGFANWV